MPMKSISRINSSTSSGLKSGASKPGLRPSARDINSLAEQQPILCSTGKASTSCASNTGVVHTRPGAEGLLGHQMQISFKGFSQEHLPEPKPAPHKGYSQLPKQTCYREGGHRNVICTTVLSVAELSFMTVLLAQVCCKSAQSS